MRRPFPFQLLVVLGVLTFVVGACSNSGSDTTLASTTVAEPTTTTTIEATTTTDTTPTTTLPEIDDAGLGGPGPHGVGSTRFDTIDTLRDGRPVSVLVY